MTLQNMLLTLSPSGKLDYHGVSKTLDVGPESAIAYHPKVGTVITGGSRNAIKQSLDGKTFNCLGRLPEKATFRHRMCVVEGGGKIFITGGQLETNTWLCDLTGKLLTLPTWQAFQSCAGCGVARKSDGEEEVVVVGGWDKCFNDVSIYSFATNTWWNGGIYSDIKTVGNLELALNFFVGLYGFPRHVDSMAVAQIGDTFLLVGGMTEGGEALNTIYRYEPDSGSFTLLETRLSHIRTVKSAVVVGKWGEQYLKRNNACI